MMQIIGAVDNVLPSMEKIMLTKKIMYRNCVSVLSTHTHTHYINLT